MKLALILGMAIMARSMFNGHAQIMDKSRNTYILRTFDFYQTVGNLTADAVLCYADSVETFR